MTPPKGTPQVNPDTGKYITIGTSVLSPQAIATWLRNNYPEDEALDLLKRIGDSHGWTPQLNKTGLLLLKPDAPVGEEVSA